METELTDTEILVKINSLKIKHELLKTEILNFMENIDIKENELLLVEEEYAKMIEKLIK
jgi:hypothetical protein